MLTLNFNRDSAGPKVLCIGAHCDDIEIGCGSSLRRLAREYPQAQFQWVVFSSELARADESREAARRFMAGARYEIQFHDFRASYFPAEYERIKTAIESIKQQFQPEVIFSHYLHDRHQDHALLAELTWNSFRAHTIFEYEIPKFEGDLGQPNVFMPMSRAELDFKIQTLLECFPSQCVRPWFTAETFAALARLRGIECASPSGYAEAFHGRKICL